MPISILYLHPLALLFCLCSRLGAYLVCCLDGLVYLVALFALCHEFERIDLGERSWGKKNMPCTKALNRGLCERGGDELP